MQVKIRNLIKIQRLRNQYIHTNLSHTSSSAVCLLKCCMSNPKPVCEVEQACLVTKGTEEYFPYKNLKMAIHVLLKFMEAPI